MAKINDIINRVDEAKPNAYTQESKLRWIAELDGKMALNVFLMDIVEVQQFAYRYPEGMECEPLVKFPHDEIYDLWLYAKIDFANGEYAKYQNSMEQFNAHYGDFVRWFARTYDPAQGY